MIEAALLGHSFILSVMALLNNIMEQNQGHFFIVLPPGLVHLGLLELQFKWKNLFPKYELVLVQTDVGGIEIKTDIICGFLLNQVLKTPTRIIWKIAQFKAKDFPRLYQKSSKISWKNILLGVPPPIRASSHESKLFDSRKITSAIHDGIKEYYVRNPPRKKYHELANQLINENKKYLPHIYVRIFQDQVDIGLDTTGERLHKRGDKVLTGHAPIRENLASLLLIALKGNNFLNQSLSLIDPMSGSGTFLIEAHDFFLINTAREYAFYHTPTWINRNLNTTKEIINSITEWNKNSSKCLFDNFLGLDIDPEIIKQANKNKINRNIKFYQHDLFSDSIDSQLNSDITSQFKNCLVIVNPPYGKRIGDQNTINSNYFDNLLVKINKKFSPQMIGIIIPEEFSNHELDKAGHSKLKFKNGGIPVIFYQFSQSSPILSSHL